MLPHAEMNYARHQALVQQFVEASFRLSSEFKEEKVMSLQMVGWRVLH
jgi:hypothetical protein